MKIVLLIKQVPETGTVKMDETTGTVIRKAADAIVNPLDLYAVETALRLKEQYHAEIVAISMGPPSAFSALREVVAMGIDSAILVSDRAYGGSDTWATAYILSETIRHEIPDFDLILCGERATDGDTGQVGPECAAALDIPVVAYVEGIGSLKNDLLDLIRMTEDGIERVSLQLPALITVVKAVAEPRLPTLDGKIRARKLSIPIRSQQELKLNPDWIGLNGSPTQVVKIFRPKLTRTCMLKHASDDTALVEAVNSLCSILREKELIES